MATLELDLQDAMTHSAEVPTHADFHQWILAALVHSNDDFEVTVRLVDIEESQALNYEYRGKNKPTNVLSFPFEAPAGLELPLLGDLVICTDVVQQEAIEQQKPVLHHWAHLTIHGILHLCGYDHINDDEADEMESLEISILERLNIPNPYLINE
jgi:probable rRNA maturation factor